MEHVEGVLTERKIVHDDEWYEMNRLLDDYEVQYGYGQRYWWRQINLTCISNDAKFTRMLLRIEEVNLLRRNNLLLRDWSGRSTFKQLYYGMFDATRLVTSLSPKFFWNLKTKVPSYSQFVSKTPFLTLPS